MSTHRAVQNIPTVTLFKKRIEKKKKSISLNYQMILPYWYVPVRHSPRKILVLRTIKIIEMSPLGTFVFLEY